MTAVSGSSIRATADTIGRWGKFNHLKRQCKQLQPNLEACAHLFISLHCVTHSFISCLMGTRKPMWQRQTSSFLLWSDGLLGSTRSLGTTQLQSAWSSTAVSSMVRCYTWICRWQNSSQRKLEYVNVNVTLISCLRLFSAFGDGEQPDKRQSHHCQLHSYQLVLWTLETIPCSPQ